MLCTSVFVDDIITIISDVFAELTVVTDRLTNRPHYSVCSSRPHLARAAMRPNITTTTVLRPFVQHYPGEPVPEETLTHPPSWSSSNLYQLLLSTTIHSILPVQIMCLAIFCTTSFHVLFGLALSLEPSTSYSIHFFTQSMSSFRSTSPYHCNLFCCSINIISSIPSLSLNSAYLTQRNNNLEMVVQDRDIVTVED